ALQRDALAVALGESDGAPPQPVVVALAALGVLAAAAQERPLLCIVDDLHWIDPASRTVLLFAARRLQRDPVAMVFSVRAEEWVTLRERGLPTREIRDLDASSASALLADAASGPVSGDVAERLFDATGGNPLALTEIADGLTAHQLAGREPLPVPLPLTAGI